MAFLSEKRAQHWDATHNVYAYLLRENQAQRYSDDGEPQGTAGQPVLEVLRREGLTDVIVVVTRYFGGILLGAGGLVRAYSHGAKIAVDAARRLRMTPCARLRLQFDYSFYGRLSRLLPRFGVKTAASDFGAAVTVELLVAQEQKTAFLKELEELSAGQVHPEEMGLSWEDMA